MKYDASFNIVGVNDLLLPRERAVPTRFSTYGWCVYVAVRAPPVTFSQLSTTASVLDNALYEAEWR